MNIGEQGELIEIREEERPMKGCNTEVTARQWGLHWEAFRVPQKYQPERKEALCTSWERISLKVLNTPHHDHHTHILTRVCTTIVPWCLRRLCTVVILGVFGDAIFLEEFVPEKKSFCH